MISPNIICTASTVENEENYRTDVETLNALEDLDQPEILALLEVIEEIPPALLENVKEPELLAYFEDNGIYYKIVEDGGVVSTMIA